MTFEDGSCVNLFSGCDDPVSDFPFAGTADAIVASQALLDQVFVDGPLGDFDSIPGLTRGCSFTLECSILTPMDLTSFGGLTSSGEINLDIGDTTRIFGGGTGFDTGTAEDSFSQVFAVWTQVPEPGTGLLVALGLLTLGVRTRRET